MNKQKLIVDFLEWMTEAAKNNPRVIHIDNEGLADIYLSSDRSFLKQKPVSSRTFEDLCEIIFNPKTDHYHFYYAGKEEMRSKSEFECKVAKKQLQKKLKV